MSQSKTSLTRCEYVGRWAPVAEFAVVNFICHGETMIQQTRQQPELETHWQIPVLCCPFRKEELSAEQDVPR